MIVLIKFLFLKKIKKKKCLKSYQYSTPAHFNNQYLISKQSKGENSAQKVCFSENKKTQGKHYLKIK